MIIRYHINPFDFQEQMTVSDIQSYVDIVLQKEEERQKELQEQSRSGNGNSAYVNNTPKLDFE